MTQSIKIKYFTDKIDKLRYIDGKSDWIDLRAAQYISMSAGEFRLIPLGVAMELPSGYEAHIAPRSSTFKNYGLLMTNSIGIVDELYKGDNDEWLMSVYATRDTIINLNDRICQFRIVEHQPKIEFEEVESLENEDRSGFGSTGMN
jgi:dUTP pyrophosphatase